MLEWLRTRGAFLRLLYPGFVARRHVADDEEHLVSLVSDWTNWWDDLDLLFYWGAEGRMRQSDRLVFEALDTGIRVVADGFGDYGSRDHRKSPECAQILRSRAGEGRFRAGRCSEARVDVVRTAATR